ncbi:MAG: hypothetical protein KGI50_05500 [Patescibacteria group bacterium]|nr:hypothetical protein [Patescibacteria group bacterium]MDE2438910.1 hypothetical protein [Patescibacteria group bacterium]
MSFASFISGIETDVSKFNPVTTFQGLGAELDGFEKEMKSGLGNVATDLAALQSYASEATGVIAEFSPLITALAAAFPGTEGAAVVTAAASLQKRLDAFSKMPVPALLTNH